MMSLRRPLLLLAMLAALVVAPPSVSGAAPNRLSAADVSPRRGSITSLFVFSVEYHSTAGNPAQSVTTSVAGITLPLVLVSGSTLDGTWQTARRLPPGSWPVTFKARVAKGPQPPPLGAGTLEVSAGPSSGSSSTPVSSVQDPGTGSSTRQPAPLVTATPVASAAPAPAAEGRAPRASASPAPAASAGATKPGTNERPRARRSRSEAPSASAAGALLSATTPPKPGATDEPGDPPMLWQVLLLGLSAVGAVALVGTAWLLLAGRHDREPATADSATSGAEPDIAMEAIATVERRALRRARLRQSDDPILAALGLDRDSEDD